MNRRDILIAGTTLGATALISSGNTHAQAPKAAATGPGKKKPFKLRYAFNIGQFKNHAPGGPVDELKFAADQGFTAVEDNAIKGRPIEVQEQMAKQIQKSNMTMGIFVMNGKTGFKGGGSIATGDPTMREDFLKEVQESIEVAKRMNAKWMTSLVGNADAKLPRGFQFANVLDALRRASEILEPHALMMVFEPLNIYENHPGFFIWRNDDMYSMMKAVRSPSCKMLYDLYHSQISEGHLIYNFDKCFDEIGYVQTGDVPGRKEPGTGEVNYRNVFKHIHEKGYKGLLGMEHGKSQQGKEGEIALIKSYRDADNF